MDIENATFRKAADLVKDGRIQISGASFTGEDDVAIGVTISFSLWKERNHAVAGMYPGIIFKTPRCKEQAIFRMPCFYASLLEDIPFSTSQLLDFTLAKSHHTFSPVAEHVILETGTFFFSVTREFVECTLKLPKTSFMLSDNRLFFSHDKQLHHFFQR